MHISVREAAARLNVHPRTVRRLIETGELPAVRPTPRTTRVLEEAVTRRLEPVKASRGSK